MIITGDIDPQQNRPFLTKLGEFMHAMEKPFRNIEMQTSGVMLDDSYLRFLRNHVGVTTVALSLDSFDDCINYNIKRTPGWSIRYPNPSPPAEPFESMSLHKSGSPPKGGSSVLSSISMYETCFPSFTL